MGRIANRQLWFALYITLKLFGSENSPLTFTLLDKALYSTWARKYNLSNRVNPLPRRGERRYLVSYAVLYAPCAMRFSM